MTENTESAEPFRVVVFADFVCPYSFLAVDQIDRLAREYDVKPLWRPHWLHPETPPEGTPGARTPERTERLRAWIKDMAPEHLDRIRIPGEAAVQLPRVRGARVRLRPRPRLRVQDRALRPDVDRRSATSASPTRCWRRPNASGSIRPSSKSRWTSALYAERTLEAIKQARDIGITNTPTIFLGKTRINGWTYYEVMQSVMEKQGMRPREALAS